MAQVHIKTTCDVKDPRPYLKGQGHTCSFSVCTLTFKDFKIIWHKCLAYQDAVSGDRSKGHGHTCRLNVKMQPFVSGL